MFILGSDIFYLNSRLEKAKQYIQEFVLWGICIFLYYYYSSFLSLDSEDRRGFYEEFVWFYRGLRKPFPFSFSDERATEREVWIIYMLLQCVR